MKSIYLVVATAIFALAGTDSVLGARRADSREERTPVGGVFPARKAPAKKSPVVGVPSVKKPPVVGMPTNWKPEKPVVGMPTNWKPEKPVVGVPPVKKPPAVVGVPPVKEPPVVGVPTNWKPDKPEKPVVGVPTNWKPDPVLGVPPVQREPANESDGLPNANSAPDIKIGDKKKGGRVTGFDLPTELQPGYVFPSGEGNPSGTVIHAPAGYKVRSAQ